MKRSVRVAAIAIAAAASLALAACSGGTSSTSKTVHLTYWTWAPGVSKITETWNKAHPDIQVKVVQAAGADDILAKLLAAERAGNGPDIAAAEYQKLPNLVVSGAAADITADVADIKKNYTASTWKLATIGGKVYGIPQDTAPMVLMYRADLFDKYGLTLPKTWDDYAALAAKVKQVAPTAFLGGYPDDASTFAGYAQPLNSNWYSTDGKSWTVGIDGAADQRVAKFWQALVEAGTVDTTHFFTPEWNTEMNNGTLLTWTAGVWAPGTVESVAPDTKGLWKVAPMPSWDGEKKVGFMGGSTAMVTKTSKHPKEAVEYLSWLNASKTGSALLAKVGGLFPASIPGQNSLVDLPVPAIVSDQPDFWKVAVGVAKNTASVTWGPNVQVAFDTYGDAIKAATANKTSYVDVLKKTQDATVADLKKTGFTVK